jgi:hypothetical protein
MIEESVQTIGGHESLCPRESVRRRMAKSALMLAALLVLLPVLCSTFSLVFSPAFGRARLNHGLGNCGGRRACLQRQLAVMMAKKGVPAKAQGPSGAAKGGFGAAVKQKAPKEADLAAAPGGVGLPQVEKFDLGDAGMFMGGFVIKDESVTHLTLSLT